MKDIELACFLQHFFEAGMGTDIGDVHAAASGTSIPTRCGSHLLSLEKDPQSVQTVLRDQRKW